MNEYTPPPLWQVLSRERQRRIVMMLGQVALRQLRHASLPEEGAE
jgi:hypothetical protein